MLTRDLGWLRLDVSAAIAGAEVRDPRTGQYHAGTYADVGASLSRTVQLSRWMTGWLSLGISQRIWYGEPPPDESSGLQAWLTIGTTFR